jgi:asparagine synthase (glutamine-hydrolysing)
LDRRLAEFCLAVPAEQHRSNGWNRYLIRRTMDGILPDKTVWTPRKSAEPTDPWGPFRSSEAERYILEQIELYRSSSEVVRYLDLDLLFEYWNDIKKVAFRPFDPFKADIVAESKRRHFSRGFMMASFLRQYAC